MTISEVAWMGTAVSADDEWIELHNTGTENVSVDGWELTDGANLNIALSGTIASDEYAVLERTDDGTVPGTAFLIYKGSLANSGATLSLYDADPNHDLPEYKIEGGDGWTNIGGDNTTKETAQYTGTKWVTAPATAGFGLTNYEPPAEDIPQENTSGAASSEVVAKSNTNKLIQLKLPDVSLSLAVQIPDSVYVHQAVPFSVEPSGLGKELLDSVGYQWNFGDLSTSTQKDPVHAFAYPGEYVVTLYASYARHEQTAQKKIVVLPVSFALATNSNGDILLQNNAKYEVDISGYQLVGEKSISIPSRTILLPNATLTIPKKIIADKDPFVAVLYDQQLTEVARLDLQTHASVVNIMPVAVRSQQLPSEQTDPALEPLRDFSFTGEVSNSLATQSMQAATGTQKIATSTQVSAVSSAHNKIPPGALPFLGLFGLISVGLFAVFSGRLG